MCKVTSFFGFCFFFAFFSFLAVHFTYMKMPGVERTVASQHHTVRPMYDASWKL